MLISTTDISPLHSLLPGVWSRDEDGFGDATGEPGDKLGGTNMFPSPYSVWPKNILQFAEYAGSNIMNPRVTLNTSVWIFSPSTPILTRDTVTRNPSCPLLHHDISLSGLQSHPLPSIVTCDICSNARTCSSEYSNWHQDLERPNDGKQHLAIIEWGSQYVYWLQTARLFPTKTLQITSVSAQLLPPPPLPPHE